MELHNSVEKMCEFVFDSLKAVMREHYETGGRRNSHKVFLSYAFFFFFFCSEEQAVGVCCDGQRPVSHACILD